MSLLGTSVAQSIAGIGQAERTTVRERKQLARTGPAPRGQDEVELDSTQTAEAVRNLKDNAQEETAEDRTEQDRYRPAHNTAPNPPAPKHIDVQG